MEISVHPLMVPDAKHLRHLNVLDPGRNNIGDTDQRSKIGTFNIAPVWTRLIGSLQCSLWARFARRDQYSLLSEQQPVCGSGADQLGNHFTRPQATNAGLRSDVSYVKAFTTSRPELRLSILS